MPKQAKDQKKTENKNKSVEKDKKEKKVKNQSPAKSPEKNAQKSQSSKSPAPAKDGKKAVAKPKEESKRRSLSKDEKPKKRSKSSMSPGKDDSRKAARDKKKEKKMKKAEKDPAKPKGPIRAYFQFTGPGMVELRKPGGEYMNADSSFKTNPETKEPWKHTELMALLAARWGAMSDDEKAPYRKLEEQELARHKREMEEYTEKGYYTRADGTKSNEGVESQEHPASDSEAKPVQKKQSKARVAKNKKKEEKKSAELSDEDS